MRSVTASTVPVNDIMSQPAGTVVYIELEAGASVSSVQSYLAGRARSAGVKITTKAKLLIDSRTTKITKVVRVEITRSTP